MYSFFKQLNVKKFYLKKNQFSLSTQFSSIWPVGVTIPGQSGPRSDGNKGVLRISQNFSITGASTSDCLVSYPGHSMRESYPSPEM